MGNNRTMRNMRKGFKAPQATTNDSVDMDSTSLSWDKKIRSGQVKNQETAGKGNITNTEDTGGFLEWGLRKTDENMNIENSFQKTPKPILSYS